MLNSIAGLLAGGVAAATSSYESIATVTVGAGGTSTITFSSIPSTYQHLQLRVFAKDTQASTGEDIMFIRFNSDSTTNYSSHRLYGNGTTITSVGNANLSSIYSDPYPLANYTNIFSGQVWDILDYANTSKYKTVRLLGGYDTNGAGSINLNSGNWRSTSAITSITITPGYTGIAQYSHFALYGIKGA